MTLEQSELHKQVFGESDDDDLSDLGEVHFSDDDIENTISQPPKITLKPGTQSKEPPKKLRLKWSKPKRLSEEDKDKDYVERRPAKSRRRRRKGGEVVENSDVLTDVQNDQKLSSYDEIKRRVDKDFDEALRAASGRRKKRKDIDLETNRDDEAQQLYSLMISAADLDIALNNERKPAVKKLEFIEHVAWTLKKANMLDTLLEHNILESIRAWLEPLPDASLPNIAVQKSLFEVLEKIPMTIQLLRQSGIGRIVHFYEEHPRNDVDITKRAAKLVAKWSAPIFGKSLNYRDKKIVYYQPKDGEMSSTNGVCGSVSFASLQGVPSRKKGPDPYKNLRSRMAQIKKGINFGFLMLSVSLISIKVDQHSTYIFSTAEEAKVACHKNVKAFNGIYAAARGCPAITNRHFHSGSKKEKPRPFFSRLRDSLKKTEIKWYPIPVSLGVALLVAQQIRHAYNRQQTERDPPRPVVRGAWQVHVANALPLRAISRLLGRLNNDYDLPVFMREPVYKLYAWIFGCNMDEIKDDLKSYRNLGAFFYRELKPGVRVIGEKSDVVSPSDGRVLAFGQIIDGRISQVKGSTYLLDALLGNNSSPTSPSEALSSFLTPITITDEKEFATLNGITYSLEDLIGEDKNSAKEHIADKKNELVTALTAVTAKSSETNSLFFCVFYLAPGDYHRFHSPANWVVEKRRHFAGELYSVSPYMAKILPDLFVLNERVALLGRWRYGFFSMVAVGATNVGSIKINFDPALRTNKKEDVNIGSYVEVSYKNASKLLQGLPFRKGGEIGGFCFGSTIVLVFEAPRNFKFCIESGQKIDYGMPIGSI
ncbi:8807_t:CDS:10 [Paraglomus brasilianum]|uniref:Phosphatidylserine decarboxylase proenzyme 1, mitochondrial n=1 Tax=Paraglomus brasilianum TaxID=144538 RepID=A0A9N9FKI6_9GLOM|nr:8807_t:CDS:10 [Paraglomus brasilianum]